MNLLYLLAFVFILGSAVILHEFGHFIVAKLLGIRVETFSVGFGKRLWGRRWGTTDYRLSLVPLGGYVKLGGDESNAGLEEGAGEEIPAGERFDLRPRWQKFLVGVAGPVMNVLTALAIPFVGAMTVGVPARNTTQVRQYIIGHPKSSIRITLERKGERMELTTPEERLQGNTLGFTFVPPPLERVGPGEALSVAVQTNIEILRLTGLALGQVFSGKMAIGEAVGGPIAIAQASYEAAENYGWGGVFEMLGFLSLNLGIFNLLPIPVLDGGMIFMLLIEGLLGLAGMKLSLRMRERIQQIGFVFLLLLMGFVIINDVTKFAPGWFGSKEKPAATQQK